MNLEVSERFSIRHNIIIRILLLFTYPVHEDVEIVAELVSKDRHALEKHPIVAHNVGKGIYHLRVTPTKAGKFILHSKINEKDISGMVLHPDYRTKAH
jgi:hypothetical protein